MIGITDEYLTSVQPRNKSIGEMVMVAYYKFDPVSGRLPGGDVVGGVCILFARASVSSTSLVVSCP